ncbi:MAG: hypothetical protein AB1486_13725 [Planctomycetota bacterium]
MLSRKSPYLVAAVTALVILGAATSGSAQIFVSLAQDEFVTGQPPLFVEKSDVLFKVFGTQAQAIAVDGSTHLIGDLDALSSSPAGFFFSTTQDGWVSGTNDNVFLEQNDIGLITPGGAVLEVLDGSTFGIPSLDALVVGAGAVFFSIDQDWWVGLGAAAVYAHDEDILRLDLVTGEITVAISGADLGLWTLDALEIIGPFLLVSVATDQPTSQGPFLADEDIVVFNVLTGQLVAVLLGKELFFINSLDALAVGAAT